MARAGRGWGWPSVAVALACLAAALAAPPVVYAGLDQRLPVDVSLPYGPGLLTPEYPIVNGTGYGGGPVWQATGPTNAFSTFKVPILPSANQYRLSGSFRSAGNVSSRLYFGYASYRASLQYISSWEYYRVGAPAVVTNATATWIEVAEPLSGWFGQPTDAVHLHALGFYYDGDTTSHLPDVTLSTWCWDTLNPTSINLTVTLSATVLGRIVPNVTKIMNHRAGSTYQYIAAESVSVPAYPTTYSAVITGEGWFYNFQPAPQTSNIALLLLLNYQQWSYTVLEFGNLTLTQLWTPGQPLQVPLAGAVTAGSGGAVTDLGWRQVDGPAGAAPQDPAAARTQFLAAYRAAYEYELWACDAGGACAADRVVVAVAPEPDPCANATAPQGCGPLNRTDACVVPLCRLATARCEAVARVDGAPCTTAENGTAAGSCQQGVCVHTGTPTATATATRTRSATSTATLTPSRTGSLTPSPSTSPTPTMPATGTVTGTPTDSRTVTPSGTATRTAPNPNVVRCGHELGPGVVCWCWRGRGPADCRTAMFEPWRSAEDPATLAEWNALRFALDSP